MGQDVSSWQAGSLELPESLPAGSKCIHAVCKGLHNPRVRQPPLCVCAWNMHQDQGHMALKLDLQELAA